MSSETTLELIGGPLDGQEYLWHENDKARWNAEMRTYIIDTIVSTSDETEITITLIR